jgi:hypothetical protein
LLFTDTDISPSIVNLRALLSRLPITRVILPLSVFFRLCTNRSGHRY